MLAIVVQPPTRAVISCLLLSCVACKPVPIPPHSTSKPTRTLASGSSTAAAKPAAPGFSSGKPETLSPPEPSDSAVASAPHSNTATPSVACQEPHTLSLLEHDAAAIALAHDPLDAPVAWLDTAYSESTESETLRVGVLTFSQEGAENTLVVRQDGKQLWRSTFGFVPGGVLSISVSPNGTLVQRKYSRGGVEFFAAQSGRHLFNAGRAVQVAPDATFAIDPPDFEGMFTRFNRAEVMKHTFFPKLTHKMLVKLPLPVRRELKSDSLSPSSFGVAICSASSLYAISFPTTELAVYRSADDSKLASYANPGPGYPTFSKTGRFIVVSDFPDDDQARVFQLLP